MKKKRPPMQQLLDAGKTANEMLKAKGIIARESILDEIVKTKGAPTLPGIPNYLPHQWTIKASQRIMYDLLLLWREECATDTTKDIENITDFFTFAITELKRQEDDFKKDVESMPKLLQTMKTVPLLKDVFSPVRKLENTQAIQRFFVDSFAVAIIIKSNHSTSDYLNWFIDWTQDLYSLWTKPELRDKLPRV